jgi:hypothetical protein
MEANKILEKNLKKIISIILVLSITCTMLTITVKAKIDSTAAEKGQWQPPKNFIDPVTLKIQELKEKGLGTQEIIDEL